ncbi:MAG: hypothetical protein WCL06_08530 [Bacteroidota bacterium]
MRFLLGLLGVFSVFSFYGCSTDFNINAEKQDITVVYGLLNQSDSTQYVKITKAFLGDVSAYELAQDPTLSSYGDDLTVTVTETVNGVTGRVFTLQKTIIPNKDTGVFYAPNQEVYMFKPVPLLNPLGTYKIDILNNASAKKSTATTTLIKNFTVQKPAYNPDNPQIGFVNQAGEYGDYDAQWQSAKNGRVYEPVFRFHFKEVNKTTLDTTNRYIDWKLNSVKSTNLDGGEDMVVSYSSESFYKNLQSKLPVDLNVDRVIGKIDFIIAVGGDDLSIYIDLNKPSSSIIQERPAYTNITNGIGIFSCRYIKSYSYNLSQYSVNKLLNGTYTSQLGFK